MGFAYRVILSITIGSISDEYNYTTTQKGIALSAFFIGYVTPQILGGWLAMRFGGWVVLSVSAAMSTLGVLITPICAKASFGALVFARILTGLGQGPFLPVTHALLVQWVPRTESSTYVGFVWSASHLGVGLAFPISAAIMSLGGSNHRHLHHDSIWAGWEGVFYVWGVLGLGVTAFWVGCGASSPSQHWLISSEEMSYIEVEREPQVSRVDGFVPWSRLLLNRAVVSMSVAHFCHNWLSYLILSWM